MVDPVKAAIAVVWDDITTMTTRRDELLAVLKEERAASMSIEEYFPKLQAKRRAVDDLTRLYGALRQLESDQ